MAKFKKGESGNPAGKPKGAISEKTRFWNELKEFMTNDGAQRYMDELQKLSGKDYINSFSQLLEYFQPKLVRSEIKAEVKDTTIVDLPDEE
jgi:hypothetical protein